MNIIVTGGTGRLGANLVKSLADNGHNVVATLLKGDSQEPKLDGLNVEKAYLDITDTDAVVAVIEGADAVVHCAAVMEGMEQKMPRSRFFDINVKGAFSVLEGIRQNGANTRLVCMSSTSVYDVFSSPRTPIVEEQPRKPLTLYGMNKILVEEQVRQFSWEHNIPHTIIRPNYIVAGPEMLNVFTCKTVLGMLEGFADQTKTQMYCSENPDGWKAAKPTLENNADKLCVPRCPGNQSWRWHMTDVRDCVALVEQCLEDDNAVGRTFNVAAADACEWPEVVPYIGEVTGREVVEVEIPNLWQFSFDQKSSRDLLGFSSTYDHRAIVDKALAFQNNEETGIIAGAIGELAFEEG